MKESGMTHCARAVPASVKPARARRRDLHRALRGAFVYVRTTTCVSIAALLVLAAPTAQAKELVYGSWLSAKAATNTISLHAYFEEIRKATDGQIDWKLIGGGQLASGPATIAAVKNGLMDAGVAMAPYTPKELPATNMLFNAAVFGNNVMAAAAAMNEVVHLHCPQCKAEYAKNGAVGLGGYATTPYLLMCREPIKTVAELKGLKVRGSGGGVNILKIAGATPVAMPPSSATTALERGTLDCVLGSISWLRTFGYMDVTKGVLDYPMGMGGPPILMYMNQKVWKAMTPAQRKVHVDKLGLLISEEVFESQLAIDVKVVAEAKAKGIVFNKGGADFEAVMKEREKQQRPGVLEVAKEHGVKDAEKLLDAYETAIMKWEKLTSEPGIDKAKYRGLLDREIFSKIDAEKL